MPYRRKKLTFAISSPDEFLSSLALSVSPWPDRAPLIRQQYRTSRRLANVAEFVVALRLVDSNNSKENY